MRSQRNVYLDHSATTPTDPRVLEAMLPYFSEVYGNTSSAHSMGRKAESAIEDARERIAAVLNCKPAEIVFTSGGSESDNLAVRGAAWTARQQDKGLHLITSPVEHSAVGVTMSQLSEVAGFEHSVVPVDEFGQVTVEAFEALCRDDTTLASIMYANNEVGTVQPIAELAKAAHERGFLFHTDAVQAAGQLLLDVQALDVDMMSMSAHKFYGPKGVGALYVREGIDLVPHQSGGTHESGRRAGTLNTPGIVGMAVALELAYNELEERTKHYQTVRDALIDGILSTVPGARLTGHPEQRLPSHASFVIGGVEANILLLHMDTKGVAGSSGSACKTGNPKPSNILLAMGYDDDSARTGLRLTVGRSTTLEDIHYAVEAIASAVENLNKFKVV